MLNNWLNKYRNKVHKNTFFYHVPSFTAFFCLWANFMYRKKCQFLKLFITNIMIEYSSYSLIVNILITYVNVLGTIPSQQQVLSRPGRLVSFSQNTPGRKQCGRCTVWEFRECRRYRFCFAKKDQCCDPTCGSAPVVVSHDIFLE